MAVRCLIRLWLWIIICLTFVHCQSSVRCPIGCNCGGSQDSRDSEARFTITCYNSSLVEIPNFEGSRLSGLLDLSSNAINSVERQAFRGIKPRRIRLSINKISSIDPEAFTDLGDFTEEIDLSYNAIQNLSQWLNKMSALKKLKLGWNTKLFLKKGSFSGLHSLEELDLSGCSLKSFSEGTFEDIADTLKILDLSYNKLTAIPTALSALEFLEEIDFDSNSITNLTKHSFHGMTKLRKLSLSRNKFVQPSMIHPLTFVDIASTLEDLSLYHCGMAEFPTEALSPLKRLKKLDFTFNDVSHFPPGAFQALNSLKELRLDGTPLTFTREMFNGITDTLRMLSIRLMRLKELPVYELAVLKHLYWLDASSNHFVSIPDNFTKGISASRYTLMGMNIKHVSSGAFAGKPRPVHLSLGGNKISSLDFVTDPCMFRFILVEGNPLECDCHILNVALHRDVVFEGTCASPSAYANMDVSGILFKTTAEKNCENVNGKEIFCERHYFNSSWSKYPTCGLTQLIMVILYLALGTLPSL